MKNTIILTALLGLHTFTVRAATVRCSDEKNIVAVFLDNSFNPDPQGTLVTEAEVYAIKPMETVLLDRFSCDRETNSNAPDDVPMGSYFCHRVYTEAPKYGPITARLYDVDQFGQRVAEVTYRGTGSALTLPCKLLKN